MANHLIIGLGGTGGKVIRELRKRIFEEFGTAGPLLKKDVDGIQKKVFVEYVYVDSSKDDLNSREGWKVMGNSVHLADSQKVNINGIQSNVLNNLSMYPGMQAFISSEDAKIMTGNQGIGALINDGIGGQRRRLGRMLFANNIANAESESNFESIVRSAVGRLQNESQSNDVTFHICAGLAGGTGSGTIVDCISLIRTWFPYDDNTKSFKIRLMLYMPEQTLVRPDFDKGFYQANGYAALAELNAMSVNSYFPVDITGKVDIHTQKVQRLLRNSDPFEAAYIYSNVNGKGKKLDLENTLPATVADFLFQTAIASSISGINSSLDRIQRCENQGMGPEIDRAGKPSRSRKFISFGVSRVAYPEAEIREYATYSYATQVAKQLTYNYWIDGQGYSERTLEEVGTGYIDEIKNPNNRGTLLLSDNHLMLSEMIIETDASRRWKEIEATWDSRTNRDVQDIIHTVPNKREWANELKIRCDIFYNTQFRNQGVKAFYLNQEKEKKAYAKYIRRHIENKRFTDWVTGTRSVLEIDKYLAILIDDCRTRITKFESKKSDLAQEQGNSLKELKDAIEYFNGSWKLATDATLTKRLSFVQEKSVDYYTLLTRIEAYDYAKNLMNEIVIELENMHEGVRRFNKQISSITEDVATKANGRCRENEEKDEANMKKYDPVRVRSIVRSYTSNKEYQEPTAQLVRNKFLECIGEDGERSFVNLYSKVDQNEMSNIILAICERRAIEAMQDTAKNDPLNRMVGVNILEKLQQELISDEMLEEFAKQMAGTACSYVTFDQSEMSKVIPGNSGKKEWILHVNMPAATPGTEQFRKRLIDAFAKVPGFKSDTDVTTHYKSNEIVALSIDAGFPLRYLTTTKVLKEKYDQLTHAAEGNLNRILLHTDDFSEGVLPSLLEMDSSELRRVLLPKLMLAYALGIIDKRQDPTTGEQFDCIKEQDAFGNDRWMRVGKNFALALDELSQDYGRTDKVIKQVDNTLKTEARSNEQKVAVKKALGRVLQEHVKKFLCEDNEFHADYERYSNIAVSILNNELKEL